METIKDILTGACLVVPILLGGYGLFVWVGVNGIILVLLVICALFLCGSVGGLIRSRWIATS